MDQSKAPATFDLELGALAGLTSAANKVPYFTGSGAAAVTDLTAFARTVIDDADAATARATLAAVGVWTSASDPTNGDDTGDGVHVGDIWINTATRNEFRCIVNTLAGAVWRHVPRLLAVGNEQLSHTGDTNETTKATVTLPANVMGANGTIRLTCSVSYTNSGNAKTFRARFSGGAGTIFLQITPTATASAREQRQFSNRNATNSQVFHLAAGGNATGGWGAGTGSLLTTAVDTTAETTIVLTSQLANSGETMSFESYAVELFRPDIT